MKRTRDITILVIVATLFLTACGSSERRGERATKSETVRVTDWSRVNLRFELSDRFLRGEAVVTDEAGSGNSVLYPAANGAMFAGFVLGHALVGTALSKAEQVEKDKAADEVLADLDVLVKSIDPDLVSLRVANALEEQMSVQVMVGDNRDLMHPTFMTKPFFSLSQTKDFISVENLIEIAEQGDVPTYTNRIHLVSRPIDLAELAEDHDTTFFADRLMSLYTLTNQVALLDASGQLETQNIDEYTYRVAMGYGHEYHRAKYLKDIGAFAILQVLGGNLLLAPSDGVTRS